MCEMPFRCNLTASSEIRVELSLPESTLAALQYPDLFPSPPVEETVSSPSPSTVAFDPSYSDFASPSSGGSQKRHTESINESQQHSWYYYLTEIALRRIGNRILNALYKNANVPGYGVPVMEMLEIAADFEKQLGQWCALILFSPFTSPMSKPVGMGC